MFSGGTGKSCCHAGQGRKGTGACNEADGQYAGMGPDHSPAKSACHPAQAADGIKG